LTVETAQLAEHDRLPLAELTPSTDAHDLPPKS
jgi:hypothetical protein